MISGNEKPTRDWREIAAETAKEKNEENSICRWTNWNVRSMSETDCCGRLDAVRNQREPHHPRFGQLADLRF
jgi:hypothetical protein